MRRFTTSMLAICAGLTVAQANAADLGYGGYKDGNAAGDTWAIDGWRAGGVLVITPAYEGSDKYDVFGLPYIFPVLSGGGPSFLDRVDVRGIDDIRYRAIDWHGFVAGPVAGYTLGRDESDDRRTLGGLGDVDGGVVGGGYVGYQFGPALFDVSFNNIFGDDGGYLIRFTGTVERQVYQNWKLTLRGGATYADGDYMNTYFGITPEQSANSVANLGEFSPDAGFKDVFAEVQLKADLDARWTVQTTLRYSRLIDDAADSPIVQSEDQFTGLLGLSYKFDNNFDWGR